MKVVGVVVTSALASVLADESGSGDNGSGDTSTELEPGAIVGIVLGSAFGVLLLAAACLYRNSLCPSWFKSGKSGPKGSMPIMEIERKLGPNTLPMVRIPLSA